MKFLRFFILAFITSCLVILFSIKIDRLPPLGKFTSPFTGFWQNAEDPKAIPDIAGQINGLKDNVIVKMDEHRVPHIFANNEHDLYFMQGYITARDRLWQMEFMIRAANGTVAEIFGARALHYDRTQRRIGIPFAAKNSIALLETDSVAKKVLNAYSNGVNAYIASLDEKNYPLEYKLLDYKPQQWTPYNCALLLKFMANMLTGKEYDFENTNARKFLDEQTFNLLFPDFPKGIDPVIPSGTAFLETAQDTYPFLKKVVPPELSGQHFSMEKPDKNIGSNNWVVDGKKSATGRPILCNDPHLRLSVPSIWYQQQLHAPGLNVYGVTIPGAPGVVIGFNENIAWGVTNGSMDVKDWYAIEFRNQSKTEYKFDDVWKPTKKVVEEIKVKGAETFFDTVIYTHHGPVTHDENFLKSEDASPLALRWTAHDPSNELKTFYLLNRARNYDDYIAALNFYECPGQNFVFADLAGNIAIKQQGKFIARQPQHGKFLLDGTSSLSELKNFIPFENNPHAKNPARGFLSSANQHPTDTTYPYYYHGIYEFYRNRRINHLLETQQKFSIEDMMKMQVDNYNLMASEVLPYLLTFLDTASFSAEEFSAFENLAAWNFINDPELSAPIYFTRFWETFHEQLWDEFYPEEKIILTAPDYYNTANFIINYPEHPLVNDQRTPHLETLNSLVESSFRSSVKEINQWQDSTGKKLEWAIYKNTQLAHWLPLDPLFIKNISIGGNLHIINACSQTHGPSWRMIVALGEPVQAWGIYPGGQSGNSGSAFYSNFTEKWELGKYLPLIFLSDPESENEKIFFTKNIQPKQ